MPNRLATGRREAPPVPPSEPSKLLDVFENPAPGRDYLGVEPTP